MVSERFFPGSTAGRLLIASPPLEDPNFDRSVVLMLAHQGDGAIGVVLNRPLDDDAADRLRDSLAERDDGDAIVPWLERCTPPTPLFSGGPVDPSVLIALACAEAPVPDATNHVVGDIVTVDISRPPDAVAAGLHAVRLFSGYAGWSAGQLDDELALGAWIVVDALPSDPFTAQPYELWRAVLRRQRGTVAWLANAPADLSMN